MNYMCLHVCVLLSTFRQLSQPKIDITKTKILTYFNTLKLLWPMLGQRKTSLVIFYEKEEQPQLSLWPQYYLCSYIVFIYIADVYYRRNIM